jgi:hypothetical protein
MKYLPDGLIFIMLSLLPTTATTQTSSGDLGEDYPSAEFLEFLSEWETDSGEWVGPEQFEDDENTDTEIEGVENAE